MPVPCETQCRWIRPLSRILLMLGVGVSTLSWGVTPDLITLRTEPPFASVVATPPDTARAVAVNDDWILLGQPGLDDFLVNIGAVQVHRARDGEYVTTLFASSHVEADQYLGFSVAICGDIALVGAPGENSFSGAVSAPFFGGAFPPALVGPVIRLSKIQSRFQATQRGRRDGDQWGMVNPNCRQSAYP